MRERIKAALDTKIDSKEKFDNILRENDMRINYGGSYDISSYTAHMFPAPTETLRFQDTTFVPEGFWWWAREALRDYFGVYEPSENSDVMVALLGLRSIRAHYPHISREDPTRIAVTMTPEDGARDKQTIIALGRWLRRMFPLMSDSVLQTIEAGHRADISNDLEIVRTAQEIELVYTTMRGDSACMRYSKEHWGFEHHPSVVYSSPGFGVAVVRNGSGTVVSRSVVYDNPNDPADKRYVRIYGDSTLKRRLERNGYRMAGTAGTVMDAYPAPDHDTYIMPYLDAPGGNASGVYEKRHHGVVLRDGKLHILGEDEYIKISNALRARSLEGHYIGTGASTSARVHLQPLPEDLFQYHCLVTGQHYQSDEHPSEQVWHNGQVGAAHTGALTGWLPARVWHNDQTVRVFCAPDTPTFFSPGRPLIWIDTPESRRSVGFVQLDAAMYPEDRTWHLLGDTYCLDDGRVIRKADGVVLQTADGVRFRMKSDVESTWVRLHRSPSYPGSVIYALPDAPHGVTRSGTKVGAGTHQVERLVDGSLEFSRNVKRVRLLGGAGTVAVHKDTPRSEIKRLSIERLSSAVNSWFDNYDFDAELPTPRYQLASMKKWAGVSMFPKLVGSDWQLSRYETDRPIHEVLENLERAPTLGHTAFTHVGLVGDALDVAVEVIRLARDRLDALEARLTPTTPDAPTTYDERFVVAV